MNSGGEKRPEDNEQTVQNISNYEKINIEDSKMNFNRRNSFVLTEVVSSKGSLDKRPVIIDISNEKSPTSTQIFSRLGVPLSDMSDLTMLNILNIKANDLVVNLFAMEGNAIMALNSLSIEDPVLKSLVMNISEVYFIAKILSLKMSKTFVKSFRPSYTILIQIFDELLKKFTSRNRDEPVPLGDFTILISLALLLSAFSKFVDVEAQERCEPALALLLSLSSIEHIVESFKLFLPPSCQSRLFGLTIYLDLQAIESKLDSEELEQIAKLKAIMEFAFKRYGDFFLRYYADEVMHFLNQKNLLDCPFELWNKATHGGHDIQVEFGPSFLVSIIKYQWGIIKDFHGISPDPTNNTIYYNTDLENLFEFLNDQAQQLFIFIGALKTVLNDDETEILTFSTDSDTLITIYMEIMNYLDRICTGLINSYAICSQDPNYSESLNNLDLGQSTKGFVLLMTLSVCCIQLSLTGRLQITTAPSISAVLEHYVSKSDFTAPIKNCTLLDRFIVEFPVHSLDLIRNYPMIRGLSVPTLIHLEGKDTKITAFNTGLSWNMFSFFILISSLLILQFFWIAKEIRKYVFLTFWF